MRQELVFFEPAYAKINLYLDCLGRRADGYHTVDTVMHSLSLHDDILGSATLAPETVIELGVQGADLKADPDNLVFRAAQAFLKAAKLQAEVKILLRKRIPMQAGLAGGSSDAAATLRALNAVFSSPFTLEELARIGASLGSDVPYCVCGGTMLCGGRGEEMQPLPCTRELHAVLAFSGEAVSTPAAFRALDAAYPHFSASTRGEGGRAALLAALAEGDTRRVAENLYNVFEPVVYPSCPAAEALRRQLLDAGALGACLSGSGSAVFGLFADAETAKAACLAMGERAVYATSAPAVPEYSLL